MSENDDSLILIPPGPERVAGRALVLAAVACRGGIEGDRDDSDAEAFREDVLNWLCDLGLSEEIESEEFSLLNSPLGTLTREQAINATWRSEGMAVLAWALGKIEMPLYDEIINPPAVAESIGFMEDRISTALHSPRLRRPEELKELAESKFALHWRLRQFSLDHAQMNFIDFAENCWFGPLKITGLRFIDDDLAIGETAIADAPVQSWRECLSIAGERHLAANWLVGHGEIYSKVATHT